ncbi:serine/threonine-protein kinase/endoribonuclease IRE1b-like isoform X2 [Olea europaea var. sylvestris]|uniref:non-specific serine/threonine protein kinase n=1 Tax=Olea europaea subsp. europaea TaxID=158383 RepID=A0A8S0TQZ9_OLEEU|nr:serine/threonine-protein kinase/endoribonuclease IRE1b-like isoform X2 [Olea europaea var. sylvestris]CAA3005849.1 serine threonine- kinase endoribonuclease IRE1a-like [Olea europaea subsp. europaea]
MRGGGLFIAFLFFTFLILAVVLRVKASPDNPDPDPDVLSGSEGPSTNSQFVTTPHDTAIVAAPDGMVYFVEIGSGQILWSFSSGPSIYSSYQALPSSEGEKFVSSADGDNFYIDCGDDWKLYLHTKGINKVQLNLSAEEFVRRTPFVSAGGGVMLGSKITAVFLVDSKSGKVVRTFKSENFPSVGEQGADESSILARKDIEELVGSGPTDLEDVEKLLYVTRTDYNLKYTSKETGEVLWSLKFADIEASFQCEGIENLLGGLLPEADKFGPGYKLHTKLTVHCQTRPVVYRIRDRSSLESLFVVDKLPDALPGGKVLSLPSADHDPMLEPADKFLGVHHGNEKQLLLALPKPNPEKFIIRGLPGGGGHHMNHSIDSHNLERYHLWPSFLYAALVPLIMAFFFYVRCAVVRGQGKLYQQPEGNKFQVIKTKKKKSRRSATIKNSSVVENKTNHISDHQSVLARNDLQNIEITKGNLLNYSSNYKSLVNGRQIGKLLVSDKEIAKGSNGTIVLEGIYDGRLVAVKRLVQTHHDVALKEIQNLIASDHHPNIVRWYGVEYDQDFVYLALERCTCSLHDLILYYTSTSQNQIPIGDQDNESLSDCRLLSVLGNDKDLELWKANGYPSTCLLQLMRDIVCGLAHLHELGIIHRDLKPQNVLVIKERAICAKLSDMGISKRLAGDTSLTKSATGYGSSGWQAPEQLRRERQKRAVDLFSLGCILFFCITGGKHPFGENFVRDINIINNQKDLFLIEHIPEATDLISRLLDPNPDLRPKSVEVMQHPLFWNSEMRLSFLRDASDRVELEDRDSDSELLKALESIGKVAFGGGKWDEKMDIIFINDIGRYRRYKFDSVRDLLRVIRNKLNHFRELSKEIQGLIGPVPEGFDYYFSSRFPKLLTEVYTVISRSCAEEETFHKYFRSK